MKDELTIEDIGRDVDITTNDGRVISGRLLKIERNRIEIKPAPRRKKITIPKQEIRAIKIWEIKTFDTEDRMDEP